MIAKRINKANESVQMAFRMNVLGSVLLQSSGNEACRSKPDHYT